MERVGDVFFAADFLAVVFLAAFFLTVAFFAAFFFTAFFLATFFFAAFFFTLFFFAAKTDSPKLCSSFRRARARSSTRRVSERTLPAWSGR